MCLCLSIIYMRADFCCKKSGSFARISLAQQCSSGIFDLQSRLMLLSTGHLVYLASTIVAPSPGDATIREHAYKISSHWVWRVALPMVFRIFTFCWQRRCPSRSCIPKYNALPIKMVFIPIKRLNKLLTVHGQTSRSSRLKMWSASLCLPSSPQKHRRWQAKWESFGEIT